MNKKLRIFTGLILSAVGGGFIYSSAAGVLFVGADSTTGTGGSATTLIVFIAGIFLVAAGIMSALFIFSSLPGGKHERS